LLFQLLQVILCQTSISAAFVLHYKLILRLAGVFGILQMSFPSTNVAHPWHMISIVATV